MARMVYCTRLPAADFCAAPESWRCGRAAPGRRERKTLPANGDGASARGGAGMNDDDRGFSPCENQAAVGGPLEVTRGRERRLRFPSSGAAPAARPATAPAAAPAAAATATRAAVLTTVFAVTFGAFLGAGLGGGEGFFAAFFFGAGFATFFGAFAGFFAGFAPFFAWADGFFPFAFAISLSRSRLAEKMNGAV